MQPRKPKLGESLAEVNPTLAKEWHPTNNGDLKPQDVYPGTSKKVWWKCPKGDDHEWEAPIEARNRGISCPICSGYKIVKSNSLATVNPNLAKEWHPTKNGKLRAEEVHPGSNRKVWWKCYKEDDHEWKNSVAHRTGRDQGCPFCSGHKVAKSNSLATLNPELAKEWHPTKNGKLTPYDVGEGSGIKVWWKCSKGNEHEWESTVHNRKKGSGCPVCTNKKTVKSKSLATLNPILAKEWHPTKNGELIPEDVTPGSGKKVWWKCPRGEDHVWKASVANRNRGGGCPKCISATSAPELRIYCELKSIFPSTQHRAVLNEHEVDIYIPELKVGIEYDGEYWHRNKMKQDQKKNLALGSIIILIRIREKGLPLLTDTDIGINTKRNVVSVILIKKILRLIIKQRQVESSEVLAKIHEYFNYTDWDAAKLFDTLYAERNYIDFNKSVSYLFPDIAKEWHPTKNGSLLPDNFTPGSNKQYWWKCPKGDDHEWQSQIADRCLNSTGCPICSNHKVVESNCLATLNPELAKEWHPTKNGKLTPNDVTPGSNKRVWWKCPKGDDHEWRASVIGRQSGKGCPVCSNHKVVKSNCLTTINQNLAKEWHPTKNGELAPSDVTPGSNKKVWWKCSKDGAHEWKTSVTHRDRMESGCPFCAGQKATKNNCLAVLNPELAKEWHPTKNGNLTAFDVMPGSGKKVWWKCPKVDDHEWQTSPRNRKKGDNCPICSNRKAAKSNCLAKLYPRLAKEWHPTKNGKLTPMDVTPGSNKIVWWKCPKGDDHEWQALISSRAKEEKRCPKCRTNETIGERIRLF